MTRAIDVSDDVAHLVANIGHELKTPIAAMGLLAEILANESDQAKSQGLALRLRDEAERTCGVVDDLLFLGVPPMRQPFSESTGAVELVTRAADRLAMSASFREITIVVDGDASIEVVGHPVELVSAIYHVIENAIQHSRAGSRVEVMVGDGDSGFVEIAVSDNGDGIPAQHQDHIFERFYMAHHESGAVRGGTGLGLAIVKRAVERNDGEVTVRSIEGAGSTFVLRFRGGPK